MKDFLRQLETTRVEFQSFSSRSLEQRVGNTKSSEETITTLAKRESIQVRVAK